MGVHRRVSVEGSGKPMTPLPQISMARFPRQNQAFSPQALIASGQPSSVGESLVNTLGICPWCIRFEQSLSEREHLSLLPKTMPQTYKQVRPQDQVPIFPAPLLGSFRKYCNISICHQILKTNKQTQPSLGRWFS